jgi:tRNA-specific 2-thiouridylase
MTGIALSGGVDSCAAAIVLHEQGEPVFGMTLVLGEGLPAPFQLERAARLCRRLGISHHILDVRREFLCVQEYFCTEYLAGRTPNPCAVCNRDIKFGILLEGARVLGADRIATGHYARVGMHEGRRFVARARERKSQEYFLGLLTQQALAAAVFPLADITRAEAHEITTSAGLTIPVTQSSQDACFLGRQGHVPFVCRHTGFTPVPGEILDFRGSIVGHHRGALRYTIGQRKGLGIGLGRRVYVLSVDARSNTITVGERRNWPHCGFSIRALNFMKMEALAGPVAARVKVRYRQEAEASVLHPDGQKGAWVEYGGICAPGQLAVFYDEQDAVLCAGTIDGLLDREPAQVPDTGPA